VLRVVEPNLAGPSGHYAEFVRALAARAEGVFESIEVVGAPTGAAYIPSLGSAVPVVACTPPRGPLAETRAIADGVRRGRAVLVLTANASHALCADRLALLPAESLARVSFFVHWPLSKPSARLSLALAGRVRARSQFIAPTAGVAAPLSDAGCAHVSTVGYPAIPSAGAPMCAPFRHLLMAGAARLNKGLDLVAGLAEILAREDRDLPLLVQVSPKHAKAARGGKHGSREDAVVARLLGAGYRGLVADPKAPDRAEYAGRYAGALVLAPYDRAKFASGVSGIVLDALLHGAPVIATQGTWAGEVVERFDAGIVLRERSEQALARAVDRVLGRWDHYARNAARAAGELAREHDPRRLCTIVAAHAFPPRP
jgi:glycosyltransferase involved in cell wall biosynthesis